MSVVFIESFDTIGMSRWTVEASSAFSNNTLVSGRTSQALKISGGGGGRTLYTLIDPSLSEFILGIALNITSSGPTVSSLIGIRTGSGTEHLTIKYSRTTSKFSVSTSSQTYTSTTPVSTGTWNYLELKAKIDSSTGYIILRQNSSVEINETSISTKNGAGSSNIDRLYLGAAASEETTFDDIYFSNLSGLNNNDFLGEILIRTGTPQADGTYADFSPSTGSTRYNLLQSNDGDTTYTYSTTENAKDSFVHTNLPILGASEQVYAVRSTIYAKRQSANGASGLKHIVAYSGGLYYGSRNTLNPDYTYSTGEIFNKNPVDNSNWTIDNLDETEFGYQLVV